MSRFAYFHEIWIADKKKFKVMKKELSYLSSKQTNMKKFTKMLLEELCLAQKTDKKLSVFISKRLWQILSLIDSYGN